MRALVTGAAARLGRALAIDLARRGASLVLHGRRVDERLEETGRLCLEAGAPELRFAAAELEDLSQLAQLAATAQTAFGGLELLLHTAANFERRAFADLDEAELLRTLQVNLVSAHALCRRLAPTLRENRGQVILLSCYSARRPYRDYLAYSVSKAALSHYARALAQELAPEVRVNSIAPLVVLPPDKSSPEEKQRLASLSLLGRHGEPADVLKAVSYLLEATYVTGEELVLSGGRF